MSNYNGMNKLSALIEHYLHVYILSLTTDIEATPTRYTHVPACDTAAITLVDTYHLSALYIQIPLVIIMHELHFI